MASTHPWGETKERVVIKGFVQDIEGIAVRNDEFRWMLYTTKHCELVVMALKPKEEIGNRPNDCDTRFTETKPSQSMQETCLKMMNGKMQP
jgi:hypothetical protein